MKYRIQWAGTATGEAILYEISHTMAASAYLNSRVSVRFHTKGFTDRTEGCSEAMPAVCDNRPSATQLIRCKLVP
ncbi:MAG: hypothetical protein K0R57_227 [Paenibacillaceae bacterium]|jgi:hypothetical protein|nr:hypothetical protein [Paenibacillaceae bacterium]